MRRGVKGSAISPGNGAHATHATDITDITDITADCVGRAVATGDAVDAPYQTDISTEFIK